MLGVRKLATKIQMLRAKSTSVRMAYIKKNSREKIEPLR